MKTYVLKIKPTNGQVCYYAGATRMLIAPGLTHENAIKYVSKEVATAAIPYAKADIANKGLKGLRGSDFIVEASEV